MKTADMRPVYSVLLDRHRPGESVFIDRFDSYALIYYLPLLKEEVVFVEDVAPQFNLGQSSARRFWVLENSAHPFPNVRSPASYSVREKFQYEHYLLILYERDT